MKENTWEPILHAFEDFPSIFQDYLATLSENQALVLRQALNSTSTIGEFSISQGSSSKHGKSRTGSFKRKKSSTSQLDNRSTKIVSKRKISSLFFGSNAPIFHL